MVNENKVSFQLPQKLRQYSHQHKPWTLQTGTWLIAEFF
jgi:hypothetical protein